VQLIPQKFIIGVVETAEQLPPVTMTPATNLSLVFTTPVDTGDNIFPDIIDTSEQLLPVTTTLAINLLPVSTIPVNKKRQRR
jgi:hypothetical protein